MRRFVGSVGVAAISIFLLAMSAEAQTYHPDDVAVINALIDNNGLVATKDDPESWDFAGWSDDATNKRITYLHLSDRGLTGVASFEGLSALTALSLEYNKLTGLDVSKSIALDRLFAHNNQLTALDVSKNTALRYLFVEFNQLSAIDLSTLNILEDYKGHSQTVPLTLTGSGGVYTTNIELNTPTFDDNPAVTWQDNVLTSTDSAVTYVSFRVETGKPFFNFYFTLKGTLELSYINVYTITFSANYPGGSVTPATATTDTDGKLTSLPAPTRTGYEFAGWFTTSAATGGTQVTTSMVFNKDTTVYARWTLIPPNNIIVTVTPGQSKVYGDPDTVFTYTSSDPTVSLTGKLTREAGENVGKYAITQGTLSIGGNYAVTFVGADFEISDQVPVSVAGISVAPKVYDGSRDAVVTDVAFRNIAGLVLGVDYTVVGVF